MRKKVICKHSVLLVAATTNNSFSHSSDCQNLEADQDISEGTQPTKKLTLQAIKRPPKPGGSRLKAIKRPRKPGGSQLKAIKRPRKPGGSQMKAIKRPRKPSGSK